MKILLKTPTVMLVEQDGRPELLPNNDYTALRFGRFGGGRISHDFGGGCVIQETYDRGTYNCECDGELLQIYDGGQLARAILDDDRDAYRAIFDEWWSERLEAEVVETMFAAFPGRVRRDYVDGKEGYVVDDVWCVRTDGGAMFLSAGKWEPVCLVADRTEGREVIIPRREKPIMVNARTWVVIAKIAFLLYPHPEPIFMNQLPPHLKAAVSVKN